MCGGVIEEIGRERGRKESDQPHKRGNSVVQSTCVLLEEEEGGREGENENKE